MFAAPMTNIVRRIFNYFAEALGARPLLTLFLLLVWGSAFLFGLFQMLLHADGILLFGWNGHEATVFMGGVVCFILILLLWRILTAHKAVERVVVDDFQKNFGALPDAAEVQRLHAQFPSTFLKRLLFIIRNSPYSILLLTATLLTAAVALKVGFELWHDAPPHSWQRFLFVNWPWTIGLLVATVLIYNDIQTLDRLCNLFQMEPSMPAMQRETLVAQFLPLLTPMEYQCFQKKYEENMRNKAVAEQLFISESTVKTHINNMNRKWEQFCREQGVRLPIKAIFRR